MQPVLVAAVPRRLVLQPTQRGTHIGAPLNHIAGNLNVVRVLFVSSIPLKRHLKRTNGRKIMAKLCRFAIMVALCVGVVFARMTVAQEDSFPKVRENNLVHTSGHFVMGCTWAG